MAKHSSTQHPSGTGSTAIAGLVTLGIALLAVYYFVVPEGSSALHSTRTSSGKTKLESIPSMAELDSLPYTAANGTEQQVSVLDDCADNNMAEELRKVFGIQKERLSEVIQERPKTFCRSILQHWYLEGSVPSTSYPINWHGLIKALSAVGLHKTVEQVHTALRRFSKNFEK